MTTTMTTALAREPQGKRHSSEEDEEEVEEKEEEKLNFA